MIWSDRPSSFSFSSSSSLQRRGFASNDIFRMIVFSFGFGRFLKIRKRVSSVDDIGRWMIWMEEKRENVYLEVGCNKDRYPGFVWESVGVLIRCWLAYTRRTYVFVTLVLVSTASRFGQLSPRDRCSAKKSDNATRASGATFRYVLILNYVVI